MALDNEIVRPIKIIPTCKRFVATDLLILLLGNLKTSTNNDPITNAIRGDPKRIEKKASKTPIMSFIKYVLLIKSEHCEYET